LKSILASGFHLPKRGVLISIGGEENKYKLLEHMEMLKELDFDVYATKHTSEFLGKNKIRNTVVKKIHEGMNPGYTAQNLLEEKQVDLVVNIPNNFTQKELDDEYIIRRKAVDNAIPLITNMQLAKLFIEAISKKSLKDLTIKSWDEYN
jgi:carbamoyl-phosphate synthase large subunit